MGIFHSGFQGDFGFPRSFPGDFNSPLLSFPQGLLLSPVSFLRGLGLPGGHSPSRWGIWGLHPSCFGVSLTLGVLRQGRFGVLKQVLAPLGSSRFSRRGPRVYLCGPGRSVFFAHPGDYSPVVSPGWDPKNLPVWGGFLRKITPFLSARRCQHPCGDSRLYPRRFLYRGAREHFFGGSTIIQ